MKTPRDILFDRHRNAEPKLDAIRQHVLDRSRQREEADSPMGSEVRSLTSTLRSTATEDGLSATRFSLREIVLSLRWHLAGMSAVWLVAVLLNIDRSPTFTANIATQNIPSPQKLLMALRENRRQLLELIGPSATEADVAPHTLSPPRRSEMQTPNAMV